MKQQIPMGFWGGEFVAEIATTKQKVCQYIASKSASSIWPIPEPGPNQRGPSCGFYALAYVLKYWHERFQTHGGGYAIKAPLAARTHNETAPASRAQPQAKQEKADRAISGQFSSLRHYGKFHHLTAYGSVFNADDMVKVAKGEGSQYAGQFSGRAIAVNKPGEFVSIVKKLIDWECPIIVPFDADDDGEPLKSGVEASGKSAHWVVIIGWFADQGTDYAIYYNWGGFYCGNLKDFELSNAQLSSNDFLKLKKVEFLSNRVQVRDYFRSDFGRRGMNVLVNEVQNPEFNDPPEGGKDWGRMNPKDRIQVGGLRRKIVAVYRAEDETDIASALT